MPRRLLFEVGSRRHWFRRRKLPAATLSPPTSAIAFQHQKYPMPDSIIQPSLSPSPNNKPPHHTLHGRLPTHHPSPNPRLRPQSPRPHQTPHPPHPCPPMQHNLRASLHAPNPRSTSRHRIRRPGARAAEDQSVLQMRELPKSRRVQGPWRVPCVGEAVGWGVGEGGCHA